MSQSVQANWESKRTDESREVEKALLQAGFERVDAYRYNSASIRVRVIDSRFQGKSAEERDNLIEPHLAKLPETIQSDIVNLLTLTPEETQSMKFREFLLNSEFEDPRPSML